jgi:hypothetical protein
MRRVIRAALKEGMQIAGVRPDGILIFGEPPSLAPATDQDQWSDPAKWNKPGQK